MYRLPSGDINDWMGGVYRWEDKSSLWSDAEKKKLIEFNKRVTPLYEKNLQIRVEGGHFNIFCQDKDLLDFITKELDPWIVAVYGPASDEELAFLMSNGHKKRICNQFPKEKYRYRIYLKESTGISFRNKFYEWAQKYNGKIISPPSTDKWLSGEKPWIQAPYIYVEDGATMSMTMLFLGNHIKLIEEFILRSSINTKS